MLRNGFTRFCDDPEIACCKAEKELEQLRAELTELKALVQAKAEGRLVVLPCKVGDTVYWTGGFKQGISSGVVQFNTKKILVHCNDCYFADREQGEGSLVCDCEESPHHGYDVENCEVVCQFFKKHQS